MAKQVSMSSPRSVRLALTQLDGPYVVRFKGLVCFGTQVGPENSDEPYVFVFTRCTSPPDAPPTTSVKLPRGIAAWSMDQGDGQKACEQMYGPGPARELLIHVRLMEHDQQDLSEVESKAREEISKGVDAGLAALYRAVPFAAAIEAVPGLKQAVKDGVSKVFVAGLRETVGWNDDELGNETVIIHVADLVSSASSAPQASHGVEYHIETPLLTDGDASYKAYFDVVTA